MNKNDLEMLLYGRKQYRSPEYKARHRAMARAKKSAKLDALFGADRRRRAPPFADQSPEAKKARARAAGARWYSENPERWTGYCRKRRVLKLNLPYVEHVTPMPEDGCCPHCRVAMTGQTRKGLSDPNAPIPDHIIPLSKGGHHVPENTMMICNECNTIKGDRPLSYLLKKLGRA
jgi:5-methylcytosine-specific restriction endonuclease McrA